MSADADPGDLCHTVGPDFSGLNCGKAGWVVLLSSENHRRQSAAESKPSDLLEIPVDKELSLLTGSTAFTCRWAKGLP